MLKRSKSTPTLLSPSAEYRVPTQPVSTLETEGPIDPKLRYSVFVLDS